MGNTAGADVAAGFSTVSGPFAPTGTESSVAVPVPTAGTAQGFHVQLSANATADVTFTVRRNNADTSVQCTVSNGSSTGVCSGSQVFSAGNTIDVSISNSAGAGVTASWELQY
jgi:hypothetical protein